MVTELNGRIVSVDQDGGVMLNPCIRTKMPDSVIQTKTGHRAYMDILFAFSADLLRKHKPGDPGIRKARQRRKLERRQRKAGQQSQRRGGRN